MSRVSRLNLHEIFPSGRKGTEILHESGIMVVAKKRTNYIKVPTNPSFLEGQMGAKKEGWNSKMKS